MKFTPHGGRITIRSRHTEDADGSAVIVEVQDTGMGIEHERLRTVFEAFEQGDRKITRQFGGLGLGLAISKAIATSHHGNLSVASDGLDHGTTFTLCLPLDGCRDEPHVAEDDTALHPAITKIAREPLPLRPLRLLLVEDHADTAAILIRLLRRMGHDVFHADNIAAALEIAHAGKWRWRASIS